MHLVQILLPRADNDGHPFPRAMFDQVKKALTAAHGGVTANVRSPAEGLWAQEGMASADDVILFEVMVESLDQVEWRSRRSSLEQLFRQEHIVIRHMTIGLI
jgi:hypothetical protein